MKLWQAWIAAFIATIALTLALNQLLSDTGLAEAENPLLASLVVLVVWLIGSFGTPLVAYYKGRRWWLWLILGLFGQIPSLLAVTFAARPTRPGEKYIDSAFEDAWSTLAENIYRASLTGALTGVKGFLLGASARRHPLVAKLWGHGDSTKAANLLEVWTSTIALYLLQNKPDQDAVCRDVARGVAMVFNSDEAVGYKELKSYKDQQRADDEIREQGGVLGYIDIVFYLRCLRALGKITNLDEMPIPIPSVAELIDRGVLDASPGIPYTAALSSILAWSALISKETFDSLEREIQ